MSVHWPVMRTLMGRAGKVCVTDDVRKYTGVELLVASQHVASLVRKLCRSETIGLMLPTSGAFPIAALGSWCAGKTIVPLNYLLRPGELQYVIDDCETDTVITSKKLLEATGHNPSARNVVLMEEMSFKGVPGLRWPAGAGEDDVAALVYTSGTSGKPKGVMLTHGNLKSNVRQGAEHMRFSKSDSMFGVLPQFHSYGLTQLTLTPLSFGVPVHYTARFTPKRVVELVAEHRPTIMVGIPSMYNVLSQVRTAGPEEFSSLRLIVSGSEPLPDAVFDRFQQRFGKHINEGYGMTEMSPFTHCCMCDVPLRHSVGAAAPGVEQRIVSLETGEDVGVNQDGEIRLRGPNLMKGYFKLPELTREAIDEKGYYRTGDIGRLDEHGHLFITGRLKEMMIVGGENVFPREIEDALKRNPLIHDAGATGVKDERHGEVPVAFIELSEEGKAAGLSEDELMSRLSAHLRQELAPYKIPKDIRVVAELPRSPTGKVLRRELKAMLEAVTA